MGTSEEINVGRSAQLTEPVLDHEILIVGTGFSGIGTAIALRKAGIQDFILLERESDLGGTWRDNTYPGLTVDTVSVVYSYSFEPNPNWSRNYAPGKELKEYADHCATKYGVRPHIKYNKTVTKVVYDEVGNFWTSHLQTGETITSRYFVSACGVLVNPKMPDIKGIDSFEGKVIHASRWDHEHDLSDERVAVIGTGATAIQFIPEIVDRVKRLDVYQRTPIWLMPKADRPIEEKRKKAYRDIPFFQKFMRFKNMIQFEKFITLAFVHNKQFPKFNTKIRDIGIAHIRRVVKDPEIQEKLIPRYAFFCKRPSVSNNYYPVFNRDHVELITEPIDCITETGVVTKDGKTREIDTLICATGFNFFNRNCMPTFEVVGKNKINLGEFWENNRFQAYQGATVPNFPNYFMIFGPYSIASPSWFGMIDTQVRHFMRCLKRAKRSNANYIEIKQQAHDKDFDMVIQKRAKTVLYAGDCAPSNSYYYDANGDAPLIRPVTMFSMWLKSHIFSLNNYIFLKK
jgi:cation diffusion facilitator CzcD-associated flavoprotein CzcO